MSISERQQPGTASISPCSLRTGAAVKRAQGASEARHLLHAWSLARTSAPGKALRAARGGIRRRSLRYGTGLRFRRGGRVAIAVATTIHSIAVNGRHAILLAESMVRIEMLRSERTWELAITLHTLSRASDRERPQIVSKPLFRGRDGVLSVDLLEGRKSWAPGKAGSHFL